MSITVEERARRLRLTAVLSYAFRPLFLAAGSWAIVSIALWLAMFLGYVRLPTRFDPLTWHIHEMLFGFVMSLCLVRCWPRHRLLVPDRIPFTP